MGLDNESLIKKKLRIIRGWETSILFVFQFQHFGCFDPVVKHQNQHLKASKATSYQM